MVNRNDAPVRALLAPSSTFVINSSGSAPKTTSLSYALRRICLLCHIKIVESSFAILAEPNRRAILSLLSSSEQSVGEIELRLKMPQSSVSKHLRVLRQAGFVESRIDAQRRFYRLRPEPLQEIDAWLVPFRRLWTHHVDALERHLDRMAEHPKRAQSPDKGKLR